MHGGKGRPIMHLDSTRVIRSPKAMPDATLPRAAFSMSFSPHSSRLIEFQSPSLIMIFLLYFLEFDYLFTDDAFRFNDSILHVEEAEPERATARTKKFLHLCFSSCIWFISSRRAFSIFSASKVRYSYVEATLEHLAIVLFSGRTHPCFSSFLTSEDEDVDSDG